MLQNGQNGYFYCRGYWLIIVSWFLAMHGLCVHILLIRSDSKNVTNMSRNFPWILNFWKTYNSSTLTVDIGTSWRERTWTKSRLHHGPDVL